MGNRKRSKGKARRAAKVNDAIGRSALMLEDGCGALKEIKCDHGIVSSTDRDIINFVSLFVGTLKKYLDDLANDPSSYMIALGKHK